MKLKNITLITIIGIAAAFIISLVNCPWGHIFQRPRMILSFIGRSLLYCSLLFFLINLFYIERARMREAEKFLGPNTHPSAEFKSDVSLRRKVILVISAWISGLLIAFPDPRGIMMIAFFPLGLMGLVCEWINISGTVNAMLAIGWIIFIALTIVAIAQGRKKWFYIWWSILTILLLLNGAGCHAMVKGLEGIDR